MSEIAADMLERIGLLRDKADNLLHATMFPLPMETHFKALTYALSDIRTELDAIYKAIGGTE